MKLLCYYCVIFLLTAVLTVDSYRILGLFPHNGMSHFLMFEQLMKGLAKRGHQVDVVSHFPLRKPFRNYNDIIDLSGSLVGFENKLTYQYATPYFHSISFAHVIATKMGNDFCDYMDHPQFKKLVEKPPRDPPFDLVITEIFSAHCYLAMGQHLKIPVVGVATTIWPWINGIVANPEESAYIPHIFSDLNGQLNFWQRTKNTVELLKEKWLFQRHSLCQDDKIFKYIGPHAPNVRNAERNVSLILVNSHYSLNGVRPFTNAIVEVGGLHIPENLHGENCMGDITPNLELQQWLNDSVYGFVYISFGSMMNIESFPKEFLRAIYASAAKLAPIRVLMKIAKREELPPGLPKNILTVPWVPQLAVLKHKHARAFVTHGGLMGTQEAVYYGVPMIGVPLIVDQVQNINIYVQKHVAVSLHHEHLTEENLNAAFNTILNDPSYIEAAKKLSAEFRDRPMTALDTAIYWVEYVIRHGGRNLRSPAMDLEWWQIALLDVYGFLLSATVFALYFLTRVINILVTVISRKDDDKIVAHYQKRN